MVGERGDVTLREAVAAVSRTRRTWGRRFSEGCASWGARQWERSVSVTFVVFAHGQKETFGRAASQRSFNAALDALLTDSLQLAP